MLRPSRIISDEQARTALGEKLLAIYGAVNNGNLVPPRNGKAEGLSRWEYVLRQAGQDPDAVYQRVTTPEHRARRLLQEISETNLSGLIVLSEWEANQKYFRSERSIPAEVMNETNNLLADALLPTAPAKTNVLSYSPWDSPEAKLLRYRGVLGIVLVDQRLEDERQYHPATEADRLLKALSEDPQYRGFVILNYKEFRALLPAPRPENRFLNKYPEWLGDFNDFVNTALAAAPPDREDDLLGYLLWHGRPATILRNQARMTVDVAPLRYSYEIDRTACNVLEKVAALLKARDPSVLRFIRDGQLSLPYLPLQKLGHTFPSRTTVRRWAPQMHEVFDRVFKEPPAGSTGEAIKLFQKHGIHEVRLVPGKPEGDPAYQADRLAQRILQTLPTARERDPFFRNGPVVTLSYHGAGKKLLGSSTVTGYLSDHPEAASLTNTAMAKILDRAHSPKRIDPSLDPSGAAAQLLIADGIEGVVIRQGDWNKTMPEITIGISAAGLEERKSTAIRYDVQQVADRLLNILSRLDSATLQKFLNPKTATLRLSTEQAAAFLDGRPSASGLRIVHKTSKKTMAEEVTELLSKSKNGLPGDRERWRLLSGMGIKKIVVAKVRRPDRTPWPEKRFLKVLGKAKEKELSFRPTIIEDGPQSETALGKELKKARVRIVRSDKFPQYRRSWPLFLEAHGIPAEQAYDERYPSNPREAAFEVYVDLKRGKNGRPIRDERRHVATLKINRLDSLWEDPRVQRAETLFVFSVKTGITEKGGVVFNYRRTRHTTGIPSETFDPAHPPRVVLEFAVEDPHHAVQAARRMDTGEVVYPFDGQMRFYLEPPFKNGRVQPGAFLFRALTQLWDVFWEELAEIDPQAVYVTRVPALNRYKDEPEARAYFHVGTEPRRATSIRFSEEHPSLLTVRVDPATRRSLQAWNMADGNLVFPRTDVVPPGPFQVFVDPPRDASGLIAQSAGVKPDLELTSPPVWADVWSKVLRPKAKRIVVRGVSLFVSDWSTRLLFSFADEPFPSSIPAGENAPPLELEFLAQDPSRRPQAARRADTGEIVYPAPGDKKILLDEGFLYKAGHNLRLKSVRAALKLAQRQVRFEGLSAVTRGGNAVFRNPINGKRYHTAIPYRPGIRLTAVAEKKGNKRWEISGVYASENEPSPPDGNGTIAEAKRLVRDARVDTARRVLAAERLFQLGALNTPDGVTTDDLRDLLFDYHGVALGKTGAVPFFQISAKAAALYRSQPGRYWQTVYGPLSRAEKLPAREAMLHLQAALQSLNGSSAMAMSGLEEIPPAEEQVRKLLPLFSLGTFEMREAAAAAIKKLGASAIDPLLAALRERPTRTEVNWPRPAGAAIALAVLNPSMTLNQRLQVVTELVRILDVEEFQRIAKLDPHMKGHPHTWLAWVFPRVIRTLRQMDRRTAEQSIQKLLRATANKHGPIADVLDKAIENASAAGLEENNEEEFVLYQKDQVPYEEVVAELRTYRDWIDLLEVWKDLWEEFPVSTHIHNASYPPPGQDFGDLFISSALLHFKETRTQRTYSVRIVNKLKKGRASIQAFVKVNPLNHTAGLEEQEDLAEQITEALQEILTGVRHPPYLKDDPGFRMMGLSSLRYLRRQGTLRDRIEDALQWLEGILGRPAVLQAWDAKPNALLRVVLGLLIPPMLPEIDPTTMENVNFHLVKGHLSLEFLREVFRISPVEFQRLLYLFWSNRGRTPHALWLIEHQISKWNRRSYRAELLAAYQQHQAPFISAGDDRAWEQFPHSFPLTVSRLKEALQKSDLPAGQFWAERIDPEFWKGHGIAARLRRLSGSSLIPIGLSELFGQIALFKRYGLAGQPLPPELEAWADAEKIGRSGRMLLPETIAAAQLLLKDPRAFPLLKVRSAANANFQKDPFSNYGPNTFWHIDSGLFQTPGENVYGNTLFFLSTAKDFPDLSLSTGAYYRALHQAKEQFYEQHQAEAVPPYTPHAAGLEEEKPYRVSKQVFSHLHQDQAKFIPANATHVIAIPKDSLITIYRHGTLKDEVDKLIQSQRKELPVPMEIRPEEIPTDHSGVRTPSVFVLDQLLEAPGYASPAVQVWKGQSLGYNLLELVAIANSGGLDSRAVKLLSSWSFEENGRSYAVLAISA